MNKKQRYVSSMLAGLILLCAMPRALAQSGSSSARGKEIVVAAAADLSAALQEIANAYEKKTGAHVKLAFGASGALTQQIQNGAPFDAFFSADMDYPRQLITSKDADGATLYQYATGKLVLWAAHDASLDVQHRGMKVLLDPAVKNIAVANPQHAPYGRAAEAALKHEGMYDQVASRIVLGENVSQAAQFVESGNAQVGFVALAHVLMPSLTDKSQYWEVPAEDYPALAQGAVILSHAQHKNEAAAFLEYVKSAGAKTTFRKYGFSVPQ